MRTISEIVEKFLDQKVERKTVELLYCTNWSWGNYPVTPENITS
jgi:hypothetical protein